MRLGSLTSPELIFPDLPGSDPATVLRAIAERLAERGVIKSADKLYRQLREREKLGSTGIGDEVAIPHCKLGGIDEVVVSVGLSRKGVDFGACDGEPVKLFFTVISPAKSAAAHLHSLAAISKWVRADRHVERILGLRDPEAIYALLSEEEELPAAVAEDAG